jgi:Protein of unknown function (DUF917)
MQDFIGRKFRAVMGVEIGGLNGMQPLMVAAHLDIAPPATIANAIAAATGLWVTSLPITAEKIVRGLKARTGRES